MWVIKLSFCQNDPPFGESFWQKDSLITHILFEQCLFRNLAQCTFFLLTLYMRWPLVDSYKNTISKWAVGLRYGNFALGRKALPPKGRQTNFWRWRNFHTYLKLGPFGEPIFRLFNIVFAQNCVKYILYLVRCMLGADP